jgi:membrane-associated phospholipid phosphatase
LSADYFKGYLSHTGKVLISPSAWSPSDWIKFSLILGITAAIADEEEDIQSWVQQNRNAKSDRIARFAKPFGNGKYTLPALATLYCFGHFSNNDRARRTAMVGIESFVVTGVFTEAIKHTSHKHRPMSGDLENIVWDGPNPSRANLSFPSGHAASAFALATVVASEYGENRLVPRLMYGAATLCALSRMNDNAHWLSDVVIGSAIGHFTAKAVIGLHRGHADVSFRLEPVLNDGISGLALSHSF